MEQLGLLERLHHSNGYGIPRPSWSPKNCYDVPRSRSYVLIRKHTFNFCFWNIHISTILVPSLSGFIHSGSPTKNRYASLHACYMPAHFTLLELIILIYNASQRVQIIKLHIHPLSYDFSEPRWTHSIHAHPSEPETFLTRTKRASIYSVVLEPYYV